MPFRATVFRLDEGVNLINMLQVSIFVDPLSMIARIKVIALNIEITDTHIIVDVG